MVFTGYLQVNNVTELSGIDVNGALLVKRQNVITCVNSAFIYW